MKLVVLSNDAAARCHSLLESVARNCPFTIPTILAHSSTSDFARGYEVMVGRFSANFVEQRDFRKDLISIVSATVAGSGVLDPLTCIATDTALFRHRMFLRNMHNALHDPQVASISLRLSPAINHCYRTEQDTPPPAFLHAMFKPDKYVLTWKWQGCAGEWANPFSMAGTCFRTNQLLTAMQRHQFDSPATLEMAMATDQSWQTTPKMACLLNHATTNVESDQPADALNVAYLNRNVLAWEELATVQWNACTLHARYGFQPWTGD